MRSTTKYMLAGVLTVLACLLGPRPSQAGVMENIAGDFQPISGYVVMAEGQEYIIDLGKSAGISLGDLLSVMAPGKKIVDPVTKKVLGRLEQTKAILKVVRLKTGYCFARSVSGHDGIRRGDRVRRFENLTASFWDYTDHGKSVFNRLQRMLPGFKWTGYDDAQRKKPQKVQPPSDGKSSVLFILTAAGIEVRDPEFAVIHRYGVPQALSSTAGAVPRETGSGTVAMVKRPAPQKTKSALARKPGGATVTYEAKFHNLTTIGNLPGVNVMADFVREKQRVLMASTDGSVIHVFKVSAKLEPVAETPLPYPGQILSVKWWQPNTQAPPYVVATSWYDNEVVGTIFALQPGGLTPVQERIPGIFGSFDMDGDRRPETLFYQGFDPETFFGQRVRQVRLNNGQLAYSHPKIMLPQRFSVLGSLFADLTGDGQLETVFVRKGILYIYQGRKLLYVSSKQMGGSLSFLTYDVDPLAKSVMTTSVAIEISPVAADIDGDGMLEVLAAASDKTFFGAANVTSGIKNSWLAVIKFRNKAFETGVLGEKLNKPIQGITFANGQALVVLSQPGTILGKKGSSRLLAYQLR